MASARPFGSKGPKMDTSVRAVVLSAVRDSQGDVVVKLGTPPDSDIMVNTYLIFINPPPAFESGMPDICVQLTKSMVSVAGRPFATREGSNKARLI